MIGERKKGSLAAGDAGKGKFPDLRSVVDWGEMRKEAEVNQIEITNVKITLIYHVAFHFLIRKPAR